MKVGDIAPNFLLEDEKANVFELYKNLEKNVLLVFYPGDKTIVCSLQLANYNRSLEKFFENDIRVIGINIGPSESHSEFCTHLKLNFPLLTDADKTVSRLYDSINVFGKNKRKLVLIGNSKKVLWISTRLSFIYLSAEKVVSKVRKILLQGEVSTL
jgi:peroxiredoxin Q/BCP